MIEQIRRLVKDKTVLILGFGREGQSTYAYLKKAGGFQQIVIADQNPVRVEDAAVKTVCGDAYQTAIADCDVVFKSPGIVLENADEKTLQKITSQTEQFMRRFGAQTVGITGTKGKSTTASVLYHVLRAAERDCMLVGNIGVPALDMADRVAPQTTVVFELSCHQLEYTKYAPHIAVLLNIFPEHLDHYGTFEKYAAAKKNIYRYQTAEDLLVCNLHDQPQPSECASHMITASFDEETAEIYAAADGTVRVGAEVLDFSDGLPHLLGRHNLYNVGVVYAAARQLQVPQDVFKEAVRSYQSLPHRLQPIGEKNGVLYYDDSISTIPETAIQALEALKNVGTLILGGMDRGISLAPLLDFLATYPLDHLIFLPKTGHMMYETIRAERAAAFADKTLLCADDLRDAVEKAKQITKPGTVCLLSPAAASYGFFKNFEERGDRFRQYVLEEE